MNIYISLIELQDVLTDFDNHSDERLFGIKG